MKRLVTEFVAAILAFFGGAMLLARYGPHATQHSVIYEYDFAVDGGAVGTKALRVIGGDGNPPPGAIVSGKTVVIDVLTAVVGAGASLALQIETANDVQTAAAVSGAPWSTTGIKDPSLEAPLKLVTGGPVSSVISAAVLTAGKFRVYESYETLL